MQDRRVFVNCYFIMKFLDFKLTLVQVDYEKEIKILNLTNLMLVEISQWNLHTWKAHFMFNIYFQLAASAIWIQFSQCRQKKFKSKSSQYYKT